MSEAEKKPEAPVSLTDATHDEARKGSRGVSVLLLMSLLVNGLTLALLLHLDWQNQVREAFKSPSLTVEDSDRKIDTRKALKTQGSTDKESSKDIDTETRYTSLIREARAELEKQHFETALGLAFEAHALLKERYEADFVCAMIMAQTGNFDQAREFWRRAVKKSPPKQRTAIERFENVLKQLEGGPIAAPDTRSPLPQPMLDKVERGDKAESKNQLALAARCFQEVWTAHPEYTEYGLRAALSLLEIDESVAAAEILRALAKQEQRPNDQSQARKALEGLKETLNELQRGHLKSGHDGLSKEQFDKALSCFDEALRIEPRAPEIALLRARALAAMNKQKLAVKALAEAVEWGLASRQAISQAPEFVALSSTPEFQELIRNIYGRKFLNQLLKDRLSSLRKSFETGDHSSFLRLFAKAPVESLASVKERRGLYLLAARSQAALGKFKGCAQSLAEAHSFTALNTQELLELPELKTVLFDSSLLPYLGGEPKLSNLTESLNQELPKILHAQRQQRLKTGISDREIWNRLSQSEQDAVIQHVAKQLGAGYEWTETKSYSCGGQAHRIATFKHKKTGIELNLIPGGTYSMGSENGSSDEKPVHKVTIGPMLVGKYEVTQAQWQTISDNNPSHFKDPNNPVEEVSWTDIVNDWLPKAGGGLRLLSEAEWEYACRSGTTTAYYWGKSMDYKYCWYESNSGKKTHSVYKHTNKGNAFGLVDMSGNVWEWCDDAWIDNYKDGPSDHKSRSGSSSNRVGRGGSWCLEAKYCRSAYRYYLEPSSRLSDIGFRVARTLD